MLCQDPRLASIQENRDERCFEKAHFQFDYNNLSVRDLSIDLSLLKAAHANGILALTSFSVELMQEPKYFNSSMISIVCPLTIRF